MLKEEARREAIASAGKPHRERQQHAQPHARATSRYRCIDCGYTYDEKSGSPHEGSPADTLWSAIPDAWAYPDCAVREKVDFKAQK